MPVLENARHERFIQNILKGMTQRQAYKEAFGVDYDDDAIDCNASKLFNTTKVKQRYEELLEQLQNESIMSAKERMIWLTNVINGTEKETNDRIADLNTKIKALDTLNKMDNTYQQNIKVSGSINNPFENMSTEELREVLGKLENE